MRSAFDETDDSYRHIERHSVQYKQSDYISTLILLAHADNTNQGKEHKPIIDPQRRVQQLS